MAGYVCHVGSLGTFPIKSIFTFLYVQSVEQRWKNSPRKVEGMRDATVSVINLTPLCKKTGK